MPPEGSRWDIPDWAPHTEPVDQAPPARTPNEEVPLTGINVPIVLADFKAHWPQLAKFALISSEFIQTLDVLRTLVHSIKETKDELEALRDLDEEIRTSTAIYLYGLECLPAVCRAIFVEQNANNYRAALALKDDIYKILGNLRQAEIEKAHAVFLEAEQSAKLLEIFFENDWDIFFKRVVNTCEYKLLLVFRVLDAEQKDSINAGEPVRLSLKQLIDFDKVKGQWEGQVFTSSILQPYLNESLFQVDLHQWLLMHEQGLVSPHNLTTDELELLKDVHPVFDEAFAAPVPRTTLMVPLKLEDIQRNWSQFAHLAKSYKTDAERMIDDIEIINKETGERHFWITEKQRKEKAALGYTFLDITQVRRMYVSGWWILCPADYWLELHTQGFVDAELLTKADLSPLREIDFFREIYDRKFNTDLVNARLQQESVAQAEAIEARDSALKEGREARERAIKRRVALVMFLVALGAVGFLFYSFGPTIAKVTPAPAEGPKVTAAALPINKTPTVQPVVVSNENQGREPSSSWIDRRIFITDIVTLEVARQNWAKLEEVMALGRAGNDQETLDAEILRVSTLQPIPGEQSEFSNRRAARELNMHTRELYKSDRTKAITLQWDAVTLAPSDAEISGNLAYYLAFEDLPKVSVRMAAYALSTPARTAGATGRSADWHTLAVALAKQGEVDDAAGAFFVGLAITRDLGGFCKSLRSHAREFGPQIQIVVERVFQRVKERSQSEDPQCLVS